MKTKSIKFVVCTISLVCFLLLGLFCFAPTNVFAASPSVAVKTGDTFKTETFSIEYPENNQNTTRTLMIGNFDFSGSEEYYVSYSFLKVESDSFVFNQFPQPIHVTNGNAEMDYDFFAKGGVGTYRIKATILQKVDSQYVVVCHAQELRLTIKAPNTQNWTKRVTQQTVGTTNNDFQLFAFELQLSCNNQPVDLSKYHVKWYYTHNGSSEIYCGSGKSITWGAEELGIYKISVYVDELGIEYDYEVGNQTKNYSEYAVFAFAGLGAVLLFIVVFTTVRRVKKERVW